MYSKRPFELVTVAINFPDEETGVRKFLDEQHATTKNLLFGTTDPYALMKVVDPDWNGAVPYSMIVAPGGKVLYRGSGSLDMKLDVLAVQKIQEFAFVVQPLKIKGGTGSTVAPIAIR